MEYKNLKGYVAMLLSTYMVAPKKGGVFIASESDQAFADVQRLEVICKDATISECRQREGCYDELTAARANFDEARARERIKPLSNGY